MLVLLQHGFDMTKNQSLAVGAVLGRGLTKGKGYSGGTIRVIVLYVQDSQASFGASDPILDSNNSGELVAQSVEGDHGAERTLPFNSPIHEENAGPFDLYDSSSDSATLQGTVSASEGSERKRGWKKGSRRGAKSPGEAALNLQAQPFKEPIPSSDLFLFTFPLSGGAVAVLELPAFLPSCLPKTPKE